MENGLSRRLHPQRAVGAPIPTASIVSACIASPPVRRRHIEAATPIVPIRLIADAMGQKQAAPERGRIGLKKGAAPKCGPSLGRKRPRRATANKEVAGATFAVGPNMVQSRRECKRHVCALFRNSLGNFLDTLAVRVYCAATYTRAVQKALKVRGLREKRSSVMIAGLAHNCDLGVIKEAEQVGPGSPDRSRSGGGRRGASPAAHPAGTGKEPRPVEKVSSRRHRPGRGCRRRCRWGRRATAGAAASGSRAR